MIDISKLTQSDIGRKVAYSQKPNTKKEYGVITSFNDSAIFVDYQNVGRGQNTPADKLEFVDKTDQEKEIEKLRKKYFRLIEKRAEHEKMMSELAERLRKLNCEIDMLVSQNIPNPNNK